MAPENRYSDMPQADQPASCLFLFGKMHQVQAGKRLPATFLASICAEFLPGGVCVFLDLLTQADPLSRTSPGLSAGFQNLAPQMQHG